MCFCQSNFYKWFMPGGPGVSKRAPKFELGCCPALRHGQLRARVEDLSTGGKSQELVQQLAELDAKYQDLEGRYTVANAARSGLARQCGLLEEENARLEESLLGDSGLSFQGPVVTIDLPLNRTLVISCCCLKSWITVSSKEPYS
jgi:hypothetical protein